MSLRTLRPFGRRANTGSTRPYGSGGQLDLLAPAALEIGAQTLRFASANHASEHLEQAGGHGDGHLCASFAVAGYPRQVAAGWLEPLLTYPGRLDVSLHVEPVAPQVAAARLRRQLARLESTSRADASAGRVADFDAEAAADDATELASALARGQERLFRVGLYLTVHAPDRDTLDAEVERVRALAASLLLDTYPTTFRALQGWTTTLPLRCDAIGVRRTFDTSALAASFPFTCPDLAAPTTGTAVLYGTNLFSSGIVVWDRYARDNHNSVVLATSGAGKSYFTKLETLRLLYHGVQIAVIDPEDEYRRLCEAVGGTYIALGSGQTHLHPFDLPTDQTGDVLARRALFTQTLVATMIGQPLDAAARAALDRAVYTAYGYHGITSHPLTWARPSPMLSDLHHALTIDTGPSGTALAERLTPYVTGSYRGLFAKRTTSRPSGHLIVFSLRELSDELKTLGTLLALDAIWRRVANPNDRRKRLVVVDEGWQLMRQDEGARFLYRLAKSARKHWCGLSVVTQDAADLLGSDLGKAVVNNAATHILLRQSAQAIDTITETFGLSGGERAYLLGAHPGEALLCGSDPGQRAGFYAVSSPQEHQLVTTRPAELADFELTPTELDNPNATAHDTGAAYDADTVHGTRVGGDGADTGDGPDGQTARNARRDGADPL
jgi:type IV secretory pathway VirB4 component